MSTGEIIYAVMVGMQVLLFLIGLTLMIVGLVKTKSYADSSMKLIIISLILFVISNVFPIVGVICCNVF